MKLEFEGPHFGNNVNVRIGKDIIGSGPQGAKSASLKKFRPLFDGQGKSFQSLPIVALTPDFFASYLRRTGASHENPINAVKAIKSSDFTKAEADAISEAFAPFFGLYVAVRSDEAIPAGAGLWHTGFVFAGPSAKSAVFSEIKKILESDFSRGVLAFKKRLGLEMESAPGVFFMPVEGRDVAIGQVYTSICHVNAVTNFSNGRALVQLGTGIGGANAFWSRTALINALGKSDFDFVASYAAGAKVLSQGQFMDLGMHRFGEMGKDTLKVMLALDEIHVGAMKSGFAEIGKKTDSPLYLELASNGKHWYVIQCAEANLGKSGLLAEPGGQRVLEIKPEFGRRAAFSTGVFGRGTAETEKVVYISDISSFDLAAVNENLREYAILADASMGRFTQKYSFADYSNSSAIVFNTDEINRSAGTHFNGALREAGILVLAGKVDEKFLASLKPGENKRNVSILANDAGEEGLLIDRD